MLLDREKMSSRSLFSVLTQGFGLKEHERSPIFLIRLGEGCLIRNVKRDFKKGRVSRLIQILEA